MDRRKYDEFILILKEELIPAMGCTEPIAVAYAAALAADALGARPQKVTTLASANIIKNVKSVFVPNTGGMRGISAAAAAGIISGDCDAELQILARLKTEDHPKIDELLHEAAFSFSRSPKPYIFDIDVAVESDGHTARVEIAGHHTNVILIEKDGVPVFTKEYAEERKEYETDRSLLSVEDIVTFAEEVDLDDVRETLERQIEMNTAIAKEGMRGNYGARIGNILLASYGNTLQTRAKAWAAAGSDARMNGCDLPVVINSGSGNQGLTASLPVIVYAKELGVSHETLLRALVISNLVTIHLKTGIGRLSAYCGATSAGCGAGAGITYLYGGGYDQIAQTIINAIAINSGMICD
ncbi:MAG: serine dehydratase subunit alpha family protein, partial [Lachnospiraceae bacterium]|nr:serine dehydratase subunit alpha family protein [Lachnospiraceae bacterium]